MKMGDDVAVMIAKKVKKPKGDDTEEATSADDGEGAEDEGDEYSEVENSAAEDLCKALKVEDADVDEVKDALADFIESCVKRLQKK